LKNRYRIKQIDGRVLGPLELKDLLLVLDRNSQNEEVEVQYFPVGEWKSFQEFEEILEGLKNKERNKKTSKEETFLINLDEIEALRQSKEIDKQIENEDLSEDIKDIEEKTELSPVSSNEPKVETVLKEDEAFFKANDDQIFELDQPEINKTMIKNLSGLKAAPLEDLEKTKINIDYKKYLEELQKKKEQEEREKNKREKKEKKKKKVEPEIDLENDETQMISIEELESEFGKSVDNEIEIEELETKNLKKIKEKEEKPKVEIKKDEKKPKNFILIGLIVLGLVYILLSPDEDVKKERSLVKIEVVDPEIQFPVRFDIVNEELARQQYLKGIEFLRNGTYTSLLKAGHFFNESLKNNFENNPALAKLIFVNSRLLKNSPNKTKDANKTFKLIQYVFAKSLLQADLTEAISEFYISIGRHRAALLYIENYLTIKGRKITPGLYANYLRVLVETGNLADIKEKSVLKTLEDIPNKDIYVLQSLYEYNESVTLNNSKKIEIINEALTKYPKSVFFLIERAFIFADKTKEKELIDSIYRINELQAEKSRILYSKYLILEGRYLILKNKINEAAEKFKESLQLNESIELIDKLAALTEASDQNVNNLILESKAKKVLRLAQQYYEKGDIGNALKQALKAKEIYPSSVESRLLLAELSIKRGYVEDGLSELEEIYKDHPSSMKVLFSLAKASIDAFKFQAGINYLSILKNYENLELDKFFYLQSELAKYQYDKNSQSGWLMRSYAENPLNTEVILELAKLYINAYQYKKARSMLKKGIELDPTNLDFRLSFAKVLYEEETSSAANGYLYDVLKDFPDNSKILSLIGINFYRSGQIKKYKDIKEKLLSLPEKDESLYLFLIETARLDDSVEKMIEHSEDLLLINPANLQVRINLAELYIKLENWEKAKKHLDMIQDRLKTYPRLQYLYAKLYHLIRNQDPTYAEKAKELTIKEMKDNPSVIDGYILYADILKEEKKYEEAKKVYMDASKINPKNIEAILGIAEIAVMGNQFEIAIDQYHKVIEIDSQKPIVYKLLGDTYKKLGQSQFAVKNYKQFLELSPNTSYKSSIEKYIRTME